MQNMNFLLTEMTFLRYFVPLIIRGNSMGIRSRVFVGSSSKYNCPRRDSNIRALVSLSHLHGFVLHEIEEVVSFPGLTFLVEGVGRKHLSDSHTKVSFTYMTDFLINRKYEKEVDFIVAPSKDFVTRNGVKSDKFLFLGSPKYDVSYSTKNEIKNKYKINQSTDKKNALIVFPRTRDLSNIDILRLYSALKDLDYDIIVKTRGKDPVPKSMQGDYVFSDFSWYPHSSLELLKISDVVVNFSSTVVKECVMLETPLINFHIKHFDRPLDYLYEYNYSKDMNTDIDNRQISDALNFYDSAPNFEFSLAKTNHLFEPAGVCQKIIQRFV